MPDLIRHPERLENWMCSLAVAHSGSLRSPGWSLPHTRYGSGMTPFYKNCSGPDTN